MKSKYMFVALLISLFSDCYNENPILGQNIKKYSADKSIVSVKSYGFVDLEGAKPAAIIVEYDKNIEASSLNINKIELMK